MRNQAILIAGSLPPLRFSASGSQRRFSLALLIFLVLAFPASVLASQQPAPAGQNVRGTESHLRKKLKSREVITNEDIERDQQERESSFVPEGGPPALACDEECEATLRQLLNIRLEEDAAFRAQLAVARREVADDGPWQRLLREATQVKDSFCSVQRAKAVALSGQFASWYAKAKAEEQFEATEASLGRRFDGFHRRMAVMIDNAAQEPVRSKLMQVQWMRLVESPCIATGK